jgi:hypothetical protein
MVRTWLNATGQSANDDEPPNGVITDHSVPEGHPLRQFRLGGLDLEFGVVTSFTVVLTIARLSTTIFASLSIKSPRWKLLGRKPNRTSFHFH